MIERFKDGELVMNFFYEQRKNKITVLRGELEWGAHLHEHIEIIHMRQGCTEAYIDGERYELTKGDCMIVFPNRIHHFANGSNDLADVIIVASEFLNEFKGIFSNRIPVSPCVKDVPETVHFLFEAAHDYEGKFADAVRWGYCISILGSLFEKMEFKKFNSSESSTLQTILTYCAENYTNNITVSEVAKALNLSPSYVSHIFSEKLYIGFREYINSLRISDAMRMIEEGKLSFTEIAYETGFETTRTFNRAFTAYEGCSPSEYKKRIR